MRSRGSEAPRLIRGNGLFLQDEIMTSPSGEGRDPTPPKLAAAIATADRLWNRAEQFVRSRLVWNRLYRDISYLKSALWIVPFIAILCVLAISPALRWLDNRLAWRISGLGPAGAMSLYQTVITLTLSFLVFTFGSLLVAIQVAGAQLTPRIIATTLLRDNVVRYTVGLFVFALVFAVMALNRVETTVNEVVPLVCAILGLVCMAAFLFLIDYAARLLRPVTIAARVGDEGQSVIEHVYPGRVGETADVTETPFTEPVGFSPIVHHGGRSEIVLAVDLDSLVRAARQADGVIECLFQVGDFVAGGEPMFALYGGAAKIDHAVLIGTVAFGSERTMEQDPLFPFRILVDIALKALSPAINDPTTAVLSLDQIHRLLRLVGRRQLRGESIRDQDGHRRVILRTPNWEDFVHVACVEIASCGANNVQIARRLRAMIENSIESLPRHRHAALEQQLARLDQMLTTLYLLPGDLALARIPDPQGLGGSSHTSHRPRFTRTP
jgi:uncharacterized membrane protein